MVHKYIGSDVTSMVTLPVMIFEPMTMLQKMAELMEYCHLLDLADESEDPCMRLVYAFSWAISVYFAYQRTWKSFNPILGETYEMVSFLELHLLRSSAGRYEVDGYVYDSAEEPKIPMTGKWNESMSCQPCDKEGEPLPGTELKEVWRVAAAPENDKFQYTYFAQKNKQLRHSTQEVIGIRFPITA